MGVWLERDRPFRLAFRAREGVGGEWEGDSPPSHVLRESGWLELARPLRLAFRAREWVGGGWKETTLRLAFRGDRVAGRPLRLAFRAREGTGVVGRIVVVGASTTCRMKRGVVGRVGQSD